MMQPNHTSSTHITPGPTWKTLAEFSLPSRVGSDHSAREQVATAVQELKLSSTDLERLKTAIAEAVLNAINHDHHPQPKAPLLIRVLASEQASPMRQTDQDNGPLPEPQTSDLTARVASQQSPRGLGFFVIHKRVDEGRPCPDEAYHTIELFLYLESN